MTVGKMIIFDSDGTLNRSFTAEVLPGRVEKIRELYQAGYCLAVATNQGGPLWREVTRQEKFPTVEQLAKQITAIASVCTAPFHIPWYIAIYDQRAIDLLVKQAHEVIRSEYTADTQHTPVMIDPKDVLNHLRNELHYYLHPHPLDRYIEIDSTWRKPAPGMLLAACSRSSVLPSEALFVGDMESDELAAFNAGCAFRWADEFFKE